MCETINPNAPVCCMGPIMFPTDTAPGSGDVIAPPKRKKKKRVYKQKPAHTIMSFSEFISSKDN